MDYLIAVGPVLHSEISGDASDLVFVLGEEVPMLKVSRMIVGICSKNFRRIVFGINGNAEEICFSMPRGRGLELFLDLGKVVGHQRAVVRKRTASVDEGQNQGSAARSEEHTSELQSLAYLVC